MADANGTSALRRARLAAIGKMVLVVGIWSSSFVGVKLALSHAGPLTVAACRYFLAFVFLLPWLAARSRSSGRLTASYWLRFAAMGLAQYTIGNGVLYIAMRTLTATTSSLALAFLPIPVSILGFVVLKETVSWIRSAGLVVTALGSLVYFWDGLAPGEPSALFLLGIAVACASAFPVLARQVARERRVPTIVVTGLPLGIGGGVLLVLALLFEGIPRVSGTGWLVLLGLALVNTLVPYLLYSSALRSLHAVEANIFVGLTPLGTSLIALPALGERLSRMELAGLLLIVSGAVLVQVRRTRTRVAPERSIERARSARPSATFGRKRKKPGSVDE